MNTESVQCRYVGTGDIEKIGDFTFDSDFTCIYIWIPGMGEPDAIRINKGDPAGDRVWGWNGNVESPTLEPSIMVPDHWHGYLRAGKLESC